MLFDKLGILGVVLKVLNDGTGEGTEGKEDPSCNLVKSQCELGLIFYISELIGNKYLLEIVGIVL